MTDEQFDLFLDTCYQELEDKQEKFYNKYKVGTYEDFWFDQTTQTLQFKNNGEVQIEFDFVVVGTWAHQKNTWMWSWANSSFVPEIRTEAEALKELKNVTGYDIFAKDGFECDEAMAYELAAFSVHHLNAMGMYRVPGERSHIFLAIIRQRP